MTVKKGDIIAVWFSCGAASAIALQQTLIRYSEIATIRAINNPVAEEDSDNRRFLRDVEKWLGIKIETAINEKYPDKSCNSVWRDRRFMSGVAGAPCTLELKKRARQLWEKKNHSDWIVLGFTYDEQKRAEKFQERERESLACIDRL